MLSLSLLKRNSILERMKGVGTCEYLKSLPVDQLVQEFVDIADKAVPNVLHTNPLNNPVLWQTENVIGILKHKAVHDINLEYS